MIHDTLLSQRRALPAGVLGLLLKAHRAKRRFFQIVICDHLAPALRSNKNFIAWGGDIPEVLSNLIFHSAPAKVRFPVVTMAPDKRDWKTCPPREINRQWKTVVESEKAWKTARFTAIDRTDFYRRLPQVEVVIHTRSARPYANILLTLDPTQSLTLARIPPEVSCELADDLSEAGHSQAIAIVGGKKWRNFKLGPAVKVYHTASSAQKVAQVISSLWLPDLHQQPSGSQAQRALSLSGKDAKQQLARVSASLEADWCLPQNHQLLTLSGFKSELRDQRTIALIVSDKDSTDLCWLMKNGISGHSGGF